MGLEKSRGVEGVVATIEQREERRKKRERKEGREGRRKDVDHSKGFSLSLIPRTWSNELMENAVHTSGS